MAEFGSCISTKDAAQDKFFVMDCSGEVVDSARTLDEAQVRADQIGCAMVFKVLRLCGGAQIDEIINQLTGELEYDFDEED